MNPNELQIGTPATTSWGSDRSPATVIAVDGNIATVREDGYRVVEGSAGDGSAEYIYWPNPDGATYSFRFRNNKWEHVYRNPETRRWNAQSFGRVIFGRRERYYDPHF